MVGAGGVPSGGSGAGRAKRATWLPVNSPNTPPCTSSRQVTQLVLRGTQLLQGWSDDWACTASEQYNRRKPQSTLGSIVRENV